ncbi:MAG: electron transport complex subunit RsxE [Lachnospiraceae bacterium]|nr:electron transport complex subunit RsxE [Lachnospiraceae bacterium]
MNKCMERIKNGIITENPTFVQILGMCPTLAVTTSAINGLGMGLSTTVILIMSNLMISALRNIIPNRVRIPAYIVIVASFVTIIDFLLQAFLPGLSESLGGYIKLIVVNCIILGRAESYASKNPVAPSIFDGVGMGLGFTVGLTAIGLVRELLGAGSVFGITIPGYQPIGIFVLSPGAFIVLAFLIAFLNYRKQKKQQKDTNDTVCRSEDCMHCGNTSCGGKFFDFDGDTDVIGHAGQKQAAGGKADVQKTQSVRADQTETEPSKSEELPSKEPTEEIKVEEKQKKEKPEPSKAEEVPRKEPVEEIKAEEEHKKEQPEPSKPEEASEKEMAEQTEAVEQSEKKSEQTESVKETPKKAPSSGKGKKKKSKKKHNSQKEKKEGITEAAATKADGQEVKADE